MQIVIIPSDIISVNGSDNGINNDVKLNRQLNEVRNLKHIMFIKEKHDDIGDEMIHKWPKKTLLIDSDSMINNIGEKRLSRNINAKVRYFSGAKIDDFKEYLVPLLRNEPNYVLHVTTNNSKYETSDVIINKVLNVKRHVEFYQMLR